MSDMSLFLVISIPIRKITYYGKMITTTTGTGITTGNTTDSVASN